MRTLKTEYEITWIPPVSDGTSKPAHGWIQIDGKIWQIRDWHSWDDFGQTLETLTIERGNARTQTYTTKTIYSHDEGETFTFEPPYHC